MNASHVDNMVSCPECGAIKPANSKSCWLCRRERVASQPRPFQPAPKQPPPLPPNSEPRGLPQFQLSSLMLVTTLICLLMGAYGIARGLIVPLLFISVPALFRTFVAARRFSPGGQMTIMDKIATFFASFGLVVLIITAGGAAFFGACSLSLFTVSILANANQNSIDNLLLVAFSVGGIVSIAVMCWLYYKSLRGPR
jgi:hypothetical protein